ncbi:DUF5590 domain-containing protein [Sediminibacillus albus]|nr:DUF5590 domain-containing protein [Sediminibacillus albus]
MEKQFSPFIVPNWLKWGLIVLLLLVVSLFAYSIYLYNNILESKQSGFEASVELALDQTDLAEAENVTRYSGKMLYHVVAGKTENGEKAFAYVPKNPEKQVKIHFFLAEDIVSEQQIVNDWRNSCADCELLESKMAIENEKPLLEVKYIDEKDRYVLQYFSLIDGSSGDHFRFNRSSS